MSEPVHTTETPAEPAQAEMTWDELGMTPAEAAKAIAESQKWEKRSKENFAKLKDAEPKLTEYERMVEAQKTDAQRQSEELNRWQGEAETWRRAAVGNRIEALASTEFADPSDAVSALSSNDYLDAGGQIDEARIRADLADVLTRKPHWAKTATTPPPGPRTPAPNPAQGSGGGQSAANPATEFASIMQGQLQRS
jgi:hypothetical protein